MSEEVVQGATAFVMVSSLTLLLFLTFAGPKKRLEARLMQLSGRGDFDPDLMAQLTRSALPKMGAALVPGKEEERTRLQTRLIQAGLYGRQAMPVFLGVKVLLMVGPVVLGLVLGFVDVLPVLLDMAPRLYCPLGGALLGVLGFILPSFWLDLRKASRQRNFRRALPDALDVLVICLEGGLSVPGAIKLVAGELKTAHPELAIELQIIEREIQLGQSTGDAIRHFGDRCDLEEVRNLASVIAQSERFGASLVKALRVHADTLREKRLQRAEEMAQRAATLILFPTLFFIFPGVFVVVLGPAVIQIMELLESMR